MPARQKLNAAYILGALTLAAIVGGIFQSVAAFLVTAAILIALSLHDGGIRINRRK